jgi:hypothetical protein
MPIDAHKGRDATEGQTRADLCGEEFSRKELRRGAMRIVNRLELLSRIEDAASQGGLYLFGWEEFDGGYPGMSSVPS